LACLTVRVPRALAQHALGLLGSLPGIDERDVLARPARRHAGVASRRAAPPPPGTPLCAERQRVIM
jgi:hypothetical protein